MAHKTTKLSNFEALEAKKMMTADMVGAAEMTEETSGGVYVASGDVNGDGVDSGGSDLLIDNNGDGSDFMEGGEGNDLLIGGDGADVLRGGAGNDILLGGRGNDVVLGQDGNDLLIDNNGDGSDFMEEAAVDEVFASGESDRVTNIITGAGPGGGPHVRVFDGNS